MSTQYQRQHQNCLSSNQPDFLLMAYCPEEPVDSFPMVAPSHGLTLQAGFIHKDTGEVQRKTTINLVADSRVHLFRSAFKDWFYITQYSQYRKQAGCSCRRRFCEHIRVTLAKEVRS